MYFDSILIISLPLQLIVASYNFTPKDEKKNPHNFYADFCAPPNKRSVEAKNVPKEKFFELSTEMLKSLLKEFGVRMSFFVIVIVVVIVLVIVIIIVIVFVFYLNCFLLSLCCHVMMKIRIVLHNV